MKKIWKIIIGVLVIILLALGIGSWYLSRHWRPILNERLQSLVSSSTDSLYTFTYDDLNFSWYNGSASLDNISLIPNEEAFERLKVAGEAPDNQYSIQIKSIKIKNFHPQLLYKQQKLNISQVIVEDPLVLVINENLSQKDSLKRKEDKTLYQKISKILKEFRVSKLNVNNLMFTYQNNNPGQIKTTKLKNINIAVNDILIDSLSAQDTARIYYSSGLDFEMGSYQIATRDSMYHINISGIDFSTSNKQLRINHAELKPRFDKKQFYKEIEKPTERFDIAFDSLNFQGIDIQQLLNDQKFYVKKINISSGNLEVYNNTNYKRTPQDKRGKDPHQQIQKLAWNFNIDTIDIGNITIAYEELSRKTQRSGRLSFDHSSIKFYNITNDSITILRDPIMRADIQTKFMNSAQLDVNFKFDLSSDIGAFNYQGKLGAMNGITLNKVLKPLAEVEIQSATIKSLAFNFKADENRAIGTVNFRYDDLKVELLMLDQKDGLLSKNKVVSTIANSFIINQSNPTETGKYTRGDVYFNRPHTYSFFKFIWKSLFQGIKTSAGVSEEREAKLKSKAKDTKNTAKKVGKFIKGVFKGNAEEKE